MRKNTYYIFSVFSCIYFLTSCKNLKQITMPKVTTIPSTFNSQDDSVSSAFVPRKNFFTDEKLIQLIDTVLQNNFDLQKALQNIDAANAGLYMMRGNYLPQINAVASAGVDKFGAYTMNGVGNFDSNLSPNIDNTRQIPNPTPDFFLGMKSSWEIGLWGKAKT